MATSIEKVIASGHPVHGNNKMSDEQHVKKVDMGEGMNMVYEDADEEPEVHLSTWVAAIAIVLNLVQSRGIFSHGSSRSCNC